MFSHRAVIFALVLPIMFLVTEILPQECGKQKVVNRISKPYQPYVVGGEDAEEGAWPWMVALTERNRYGRYAPWCAGFLIDRKHVLTAAHCFDDIGRRPISALIGSVDLKKAKHSPIANIVKHERYRSGRYYNDIAVVTLEKEVDVPNFNPVCLPDGRIANMDLAEYGTTVAGWGHTTLKDGKMSDTLKQLSEIIVEPNGKCNEVLNENVPTFYRTFPNGVTEDILCAGFRKGKNDSCKGDSGGPLMFQDRDMWFVVGIVSAGSSCGRPGVPALYTRVSKYLEWINRHTRI